MTKEEARETLLCLYDAVDEEGVIDPDMWYKGIKEHTKEALYMAVEVLEQEPKTGEWQQDLDGTYLCSECGSGFKEQPTLMGKPMFLWCPLCGVRMKSEAIENGSTN